MVEMRFDGLYLEERDGTQIHKVVLRELDGDRSLTLDMGALESMNISLAMQKETLPRPLTHDIIIFVLRALEARFIQAVITNYHEGMFYAALLIAQNRRQIRIDARPSDAIALAIRTERPIFVIDSLFDKVARMAQATKSSEMLPVTTPDAAAEMVRRASAKHLLDIMSSQQTKRDAADELHDDHLLELLRSLEPATRQKM